MAAFDTIIPSTRRGLLRAAFTTALLGALPVAEARAQAYVPVWNRACILFMPDLDSPSHGWTQRQFYNFLEFGAESMGRAALQNRYGEFVVVKGSWAKRSELTWRLRNAASKPHILAVDLILVTHGLDGSVAFSDGSYSMATVANDIRYGLSWSARRKLRMVFDTSCYGRSHLAGWRDAGFETASGSQRIYADSVLSFPAFLHAWSTGHSFGASVGAANSADPFRVQDTIAEQVLLGWGYSRWWDVDSRRSTTGRTHLRISHRPY